MFGRNFYKHNKHGRGVSISQIYSLQVIIITIVMGGMDNIALHVHAWMKE